MYLNDAVNVLISDANQMGCQLLAKALKSSNPRFDVVACAVDSYHIVEAATKQHPSVALISLCLNDGPLAGLEALRGLRASRPDIASIMLIEECAGDLLVDCFRGGAKGIVCRNSPFETLCKCIEKVHEGQIWASSDELRMILEAFARAAPFRGMNVRSDDQLTKREEQVVDLACQGLSNKQISGELNLSAHTVKNHLFRIYEKLRVSSRVELVLHSRQSSTL
jgi:DNA-binding NarL/FixJ family response regulator